MASPNGHARRKEWYCWCVEPAGDTSQAKNFLTQSCDILILWSFANPATSHDTAQYKRKGTLLGFSIVRLDFQDLSNWRISSLRHHCLTGYLCEPWDIELMKILTSLVSKSMLPWVVFFLPVRCSQRWHRSGSPGSLQKMAVESQSHSETQGFRPQEFFEVWEGKSCKTSRCAQKKGVHKLDQSDRHSSSIKVFTQLNPSPLTNGLRYEVFQMRNSLKRRKKVRPLGEFQVSVVNLMMCCLLEKRLMAFSPTPRSFQKQLKNQNNVLSQKPSIKRRSLLSSLQTQSWKSHSSRSNLKIRQPENSLGSSTAIW